MHNKETRYIAVIVTFVFTFILLSAVHASQGISRKVKTGPSVTADEVDTNLFEKTRKQSTYARLMDPRMGKAVKIAENNARSRSIRRCWRYVKKALLAADVVESYPGTRYAKSAGVELLKNHGFMKLPIENPFEAPVGAVLVYGGKGAGHVELRTNEGFVSDFVSDEPSPRPLIGVYFKPAENHRQG